MRRVRKTLEWKAAWWDDQRTGWHALDEPTREGVQVYTSWQASIQRALHERFTRLWDKPWTPLASTDESNEGPGYLIDPVLESLAEGDEEWSLFRSS